MTSNENIVLAETDIDKVADKQVETSKLHKQARGYLKTAGRLVGKGMGNPSLFDIPRFQTEINPYKETLSKMTAITGNLLISLWQANQDEQGFYTINNLSSVAKQMGVTPQELKLYLIYLGGYQYPVTKFKELPNKKKILAIYHDKLFLVRFNILLKENENENSFTNDDKIGTNYASFIRDRDIYSVEIMPSASIQEELQGSKPNNVLVDDSFVAFSLGLSDLAYKIFCFSGSNKPHFKIGFDKLISEKYLNLEKQVMGVYEKLPDNKRGKRLQTGHGKTRVLKRIKDAFKELLDKGHLTKWNYDEPADMFSWTYSNKIFKHKALLGKTLKDKQVIQKPEKQQNWGKLPIPQQKAEFVKWLIKKGEDKDKALLIMQRKFRIGGFTE